MQKRYDDGFRGPAVADALQLNSCWADLHARDLPWPLDEERIEQIKERTLTPWPAEQLDAAIRHTQREDAIARCIISAAETGVLPMWIAPIGEPDRPVAASALLELGIESLKAGCYRPYNDHRSDLYGRPLFVKRDDWHAFVATVTAQLTGELPSEPNGDFAKRGRTPGTGFDKADAPLLSEMQELIVADPSLTANSAAMKVATKAAGNSTLEAKADRLARKFRARRKSGENGEETRP